MREGRLPRACIVLSIAAAGAFALALAGSNLPAARAALRDRVARVLAERLPGARLGPTARIDARLRVAVGPLELPATQEGAPPVLSVREIAVRPRLRALLTGHVEPASIALNGVRISPGARGEELKAWVERLRATGSGHRGGSSVEPPVVTFSDLRASLPLAPDLVVEVGPLAGRVSATTTGGTSTLEGELRLPGGGRLYGHADRGWDRVSLRLERAGAEAIPEALRRRLSVEIRDGSVSGEASLQRTGPAAFRGPLALRADRLVVAGERLAPEPVGPVSFEARGDATLDLGARSAALERLRVTLGGEPGASAEIDARVALRPEPRFALRLDARALDWAALSRTLPAALAPGPEAPRVKGSFGLALEAEGPLRSPEGWRIDGDLELDGLHRAGGSSELDHPFVHVARLEAGRTRELLIGPANPRFVPIASLPPHVVRAVTVSEDAGFFGHRGLDFKELSAALADGAKRGRLRGASTITQQVAKNLFLSPERTWSRKVREALLAVALEATLRKQRILEVYLNVAEWGPGIVGIGEAAQHYFGKDARDLNPREAAFLATIIPNPVRYHMYWERGALSPAWDARVDALLARLHELQIIDDAQLTQALGERLAFTHG